MPETEDWQAGGFGLYVHWPYCESKCPYCDFNSHVATHVDQGRWARAYEAEIRRVGALTGPRRLGSIFFGGGTPSLMEPDVVARVIEAARAVWQFSNELEVTLEANPGSVEAGRLGGYGDAGVTRVSIGLQALNDRDLRALGRRHNAAEGRAAFEIARRTFDRVSLDLIYGRQDQDVAAWRRELAEALALAVDHLSLYQLTIEEGTAFGRLHAAGRLRGLPDEDRAADLWDVTQELTEAAGFPAYEVSNHARPGAESRHNLVYWRSGDWAGIGPGAHGRLTLGGIRHATETALNPLVWLRSVEGQASGESLRQAVGPEDHLAEVVLMGLRLREGIALDRLERLGARLATDNLEEAGLVDLAEGRLRVTDRGRPVLNAVIRSLMGG